MDTDKIKLPRHILSYVRVAEAAGHHLYSQGCALFRCAHCDQRQFLDSFPYSGLGERCPKRPEDPRKIAESQFN